MPFPRWYLAPAAFLLGAVILSAVALERSERLRLESPGGDGQKARGKPERGKALRLNTLGVAYLNQQRPGEAQMYFEQALAADETFLVARLNLGIALMAQQKLEAAKGELEAAAQRLPRDPYAWYNLGLAYKDLGEAQAGAQAFAHAAELVPTEADPQYFIGLLKTWLGNYDQAISAFQKALALYPYHASAEFGMARALERKGDAQGAKEHLARFQKITTEHLGAPFGAGYGDQGRLSLAELVRGEASEAPPAIAVQFKEQALPATRPSTGACFFDYDGDGRPDLFLVSANGDGTSRLLRNVGNGRFDDVTKAAGIALGGSGMGCAAGDFDNDGHSDLAVCMADGVRLLHNEGTGRFTDVTLRSGIRRTPGCVAVTFVDYDHDGDLDLYLTVTPDGPGRHNELWRNNGNGTFTDVSNETALGFLASGAGVVTTDFNNDRAIDFVLPGAGTGVMILLNPREGKFVLLDGPDFQKEGLPPAKGVVAFDFDKDGWLDLAFTHAGAPGITLWRNVGGKTLERIRLPDFGWQNGWGIAAIDYDNDGWLDLVAAGEAGAGGELRLLRNLGAKGWADATKDVRLDAVKLKMPRAIAVADVDGNGDPDLLVTDADGPPVLLMNAGGNQRNWVRIDLKALNDNKSGIGTKVELYGGALYQKFEVAGASGYLGQNAAPILAGLGGQPEAEVLRLLWPTGVPQDEVHLSAKKAHTIAELDRRGSSCPVLFAWNGREFEFIADMIGSGVVGHWVAPGERDVPDPDEYLKVDGKSLRARSGMLSLRFMEPMEETVYLDQVRLLAVDHPAGVDVNPNERFVSAPPFPEFRVIATKAARVPAGAWDDRGRNVAPLLAKRDRKYVSEFEELPFAGFARLHWIELDLGEWDAARPLRLLMDGYTDYFTATSMYAADQAGIKVIAPYVEALDPASGKWTRVVEDMGFPAGLRRTMVAELSGKLHAGMRRIRIVTNLKIYWDAIRIDQTPEQEADAVRLSEVPMARATLDFLGYPREIRLQPASDTTYSYRQRSMTGPYARAAGNYTRFGDVRELLKTADDRFVVFGSGEGVKLDFDARALGALPAGWVRDYFFYANGFEKDLDFYAAHAFTVEPLPRHGLEAYPYPEGREYPADEEHLRYQMEYNTRQRSDKMPSTFRYHFLEPR
jgi:Flp pilus assembly protein TadD